ncbi:UMP kinase [Halonotius terrestris]|uniref:Uridylate kinase n=1 Tax=Halonotius terrestris TaxID=2487750 RepID=A0A8J8P7D0_9EURY|nr:UMP kinase [Halonotius terrestris]TQQ80965.1 UMP kinase [Halonotius terrestris]
MKVILSLGGSVLAPDLSADRITAHADAIESLVDAGFQVGVVVGGGEVARDYITAARQLGGNEVELDELGIEVTRLNARLLIAALDAKTNPTPAEDYAAAGEALNRGEIAIMGGVMPGQTTDAVAAALAEYVDADLLAYATSTDGVYDADPNEDPEAIRYTTMSPAELVELVVPMSRDAGSSAPVDLLAAKLIERAGMRAIVFDGTDPENVRQAILHGDHTGTDIIPEGSTEPEEWITTE